MPIYILMQNPPIQTNTAITLIHDATFVIENNEQFIQNYIYPNPTADNLYIYAEKEIMSVDIFTAEGRLIKTFSNINDQMVCIDLENFDKGNYLAKINFKDKILLKK
ncbi:MAG: T9SS type A sorting domain-containing protein [Bacteroidetes bacterium]|nr:T9SS type A sorting domain-containing protein [Bacteroidota bacterium]